MSKLMHSWLTFVFLIFLPMGRDGRLEQILNLTLLKILGSVPCMYALSASNFVFKLTVAVSLLRRGTR